MTKDKLVEKIKELLKTDVNGSGSDHAISLISQDNRSRNTCFQALYRTF